MSKPLSKQEEISLMLKQKVIDIDEISQRKGLVENFFDLVGDRTTNLTKNIFGDYTYQRKNRFSVENKLKILDYLKGKYLMIFHKLAENKKRNYYAYDPDFFDKKPANLTIMKEMVLKGKSQVQAAQDGLQRLKQSRDYIRAQFLNEAAYQFDRQRYSSIIWGFMTGCFINATIYKKGRTLRKAALLVTIAHIFGQISYHMNLDQYFDSVYRIFQEQADKFVKEEKKNQKTRQKVFISNSIQ